MDKKMPPQERSLQNDEGFLTLLSRQRGLLQRLNVETARRQQEQSFQNRCAAEPIQNLIGGFDPLSLDLMNRPLIENRGSIPRAGLSYSLANDAPRAMEKRPSLDFISPKRLSLGVGADSDMWRTMFADREKPIQDDHPMRKNPFSRVMKRRRSSIGGLSSLSEDSMQSKISLSLGLEPMDASDGGSSACEDSRKPPKKRLKSGLSTAQIAWKGGLEELAKAMEKSAKSQQDIHDWDKKMGLKKSHSKTMRLCSRSRKKMQSLVKKEIKALGRSKRTSK